MKKIVELRIDQEDLEFEGLGVDIMSLVDNPAIGIDWMAFSEEGECEDCFDLDEACWPGYEAIGTKIKNGREVPNCVPIENSQEFASYDDYPETVKDNARKGIELNEAIDNKCATQVGKVRAQQLAQGEPVSEETVKRMVSYLSRAKAFYDPSDETACGTISYLLWGGEEALKWAERKVQEIANEQLLEIAASDEFGEEYDNECVIIDGTKDQFETIGDWAKGVIGLDILGKRIKKGESETKYRYAGPLAQRNFCKAMQRLQKLYTWEELKEMGRRVGNGMPVYGSASFNLIDWKGGPNCKHYWEEVQVFKQEGRAAMMISKGPAAGQMGQTNHSRTDRGYKMSFQFADEDQRIIVGPAMVPQQLIPRRDALGNIFHVYFTKETIKKIAEKFLRENKHNNTDVNHDDDVTVNNTLLESWIVEDPKFDKSAKYGYNLPEGAWMVSYKINDEDTWQKIKDGTLRGFSVAGNFIEKAIKKTNE